MLKTETVAPMPSASDRIAVSAKPGCLLIWRSAKRRSCRMVGIGWTDNFGDKWSGREDRTSDPLAPNSRTERSPSDIEGVIPRLNVHAGLDLAPGFSVYTERHQITSSDWSTDGRVYDTNRAPLHQVLIATCLAEGCLLNDGCGPL